MYASHTRYLVCPECQGDLELFRSERESDSAIVTGGHLGCCKCHCTYPIMGGVPRFVPLENYARGFGLQWKEHARTQYDSETGCSISETRFFEETGWPRKMPGATIIEVGGGSGRFTVHACSTGAMVLSLDYSLAVEANYASNGNRENLIIVQGDVYKMPFRLGSADAIYCFGVLQHTPDPEKAFRELPRYVHSRGSVVADNYVMPTGVRKLLATKYWIRPITKRMSPKFLYGLCKMYIRVMWPLSKYIHKLPKGKYINWRLLLADYRGEFALSEASMASWALLDMMDKLSPRYDFPQHLATVESWFKEAGLVECDVRHGYNGIQGRGTKP